jgi:hypothetical protein
MFNELLVGVVRKQEVLQTRDVGENDCEVGSSRFLGSAFDLAHVQIDIVGPVVCYILNK